MISFKEYCLNERVGVGSTTPTYTGLRKDELVSLIKQKCSDALWMFKEDRYIWREDEDPNRNNALSSYSGLTVDTAATTRQSENTSNQYTDILDHVLPPRFPRRSRSFICSWPTHHDWAFGRPAILIPFNNTKIGSVSGPDMWDSRVHIGSNTYPIESMNSHLGYCGISFYADIVKLDKKIKSCKNDTEKRNISEYVMLSNRFGEAFANNPLDTIHRIYNYKRLGFDAFTTKNKSKFPAGDREFWVGGECVLMFQNTLRDIKPLVLK